MLLDILITIIAILIIIYGYRKGFIIQLINLVFVGVYFYFANNYIDDGLKLINNDDLTLNIESNVLYRYLIIILIGIIIFFILNLLLKKIFKLKILSFVNRLGGLLISLAIVYFIICFANTIFYFLQDTDIISGDLENSFYLGKGFQQYNLLLGWWFNE